MAKDTITGLNLKTDGLALKPQSAVTYQRKVKNNITNICKALDNIEEQYKKIANSKKTSKTYSSKASQSKKNIKTLTTNLRSLRTSLVDKLGGHLTDYILQMLKKYDELVHTSNEMNNKVK